MSPARTERPQARSSQLVTERGTTTIADGVVAKIAGLAAREVSGVHEMGTGTARAFGMLRELLPGSTDHPSPSQGVTVEVGERQAAVDLDLVIDYGVPIPAVADAVRQNVIRRIEALAGLEVTEVNISVGDIWMPDDNNAQPAPPPRVQ